MTFWRTGRRVMRSPSDSRWRVSPGASCKRSRRGLGRTTRPALSRVSLVAIMALGRETWQGAAKDAPNRMREDAKYARGEHRAWVQKGVACVSMGGGGGKPWV